MVAGVNPRPRTWQALDQCGALGLGQGQCGPGCGAKGADVSQCADFAVDLLHPGTCLSYWERLLREDLEHDAVTLVSDTISESRRYLDWVLTDLARDEDRCWCSLSWQATFSG